MTDTPEYRSILLATDFSAAAREVGRRAQDLAQRCRADIMLLHVVENLPLIDSSYGPILPFEVDLTEQMVESARRRLDAMAETLEIPPERRLVEVGSPAAEIVRLARETDTDLIVLGSHGRSGIKLLLGSTAASVLHHAPCDVLAVRLLE